MQTLQAVDGWGAEHRAVAVVRPEGVLAEHGEVEHSFRIASVAKLLAACVALVAIEEGSLTLDEPVGPPRSTVRHLLAHAAGYGFDGQTPIAAPGRRRIYSNTGIEVFASHLERRTGVRYADYLREGVLAPLGMAGTEMRGSPAHGVWSTLRDLSRFATELLRPTLITSGTLAAAVQVQFPGLPGILPGVGRFDPLDWGLGFERNFAKPGHWAGTKVSPAAFGHFGGAGSFLLVDPTIERAVVCLTDREFGPWALAVWAPFCDAVVAECEAAAA